MQTILYDTSKNNLAARDFCLRLSSGILPPSYQKHLDQPQWGDFGNFSKILGSSMVQIQHFEPSPPFIGFRVIDQKLKLFIGPMMVAEVNLQGFVPAKPNREFWRVYRIGYFRLLRKEIPSRWLEVIFPHVTCFLHPDAKDFYDIVTQ